MILKDVNISPEDIWDGNSITCVKLSVGVFLFYYFVKMCSSFFISILFHCNGSIHDFINVLQLSPIIENVLFDYFYCVFWRYRRQSTLFCWTVRNDQLWSVWEYFRIAFFWKSITSNPRVMLKYPSLFNVLLNPITGK